MHEASLMRGLVARLEALAAAAGAARVTAVRVRLGALSHFSAAHFREHFAVAARGTLAEGARIDIETATDLDEPDAQGVRIASIEVDA